MRWDMLDLKRGTFHVVRRKNGRPSVHLIRGDEITALRRIEREQIAGSPYVFVSERKGPMTVAAFRKLVIRIAEAAEFPFPIHPYMLRHACGFKLANDGHDQGAGRLPARSWRARQGAAAVRSGRGRRKGLVRLPEAAMTIYGYGRH
jgi:integrase